LQVRDRFVVTGIDELGEAELIAGAIVEHPARTANDVVSGVLGL
jgi:hypothetical protein